MMAESIRAATLSAEPLRTSSPALARAAHRLSLLTDALGGLEHYVEATDQYWFKHASEHVTDMDKAIAYVQRVLRGKPPKVIFASGTEDPKLEPGNDRDISTTS